MAPKARKARVSKRQYEVAEILYQLSDLIPKFESIRSTGAHWGCTRTRTPRVSQQLTEKNEPQTSSPVSPLELLPIAPEKKLNIYERKPSLKRKSEDFSTETVKLNPERDSLMVSSVDDEKETTQIDMGTKNTAAETSEKPENNETIECQQDHRTTIENQTAETSAQKPHHPPEKSDTLPALNSSPDEYSGIEARSISRTMAVAARHRRVNIRRVKNQVAFTKRLSIAR